MKRRFAVVALAFLATGAAQAQQSRSNAASESSSADGQVEEALSALPPDFRPLATVKDLTGKTLREGTSAYTCFATPNGPMCMDEPFLSWMNAWMSGEPTSTSKIGISYMLAGDAPDGGASNIDPAATAPEPGNDWVVEGPHVMIIVPDPAILSGLPTTPVKDGPYVMWSGTPYAHIMVPVAQRPEQPELAAK